MSGRLKQLVGALMGVVLTAACATTKVDSEEARTLVGQENGVRLAATYIDRAFNTANSIALTYEVENTRSESIAIADLVPQVSYDRESATITVSLGSEVPGNVVLPRLIRIAPGEKKTLNTKAQLNFLAAAQYTSDPRFLEVRLNFLSDIEPFKAYIDIPENGVADPKAADELFVTWVDRNLTVTTNVVPIRWTMPQTGRDSRRF